MDLLGHLDRRRLIKSLSASAAYDLSRAGTGNYSVDPSNLFTYINSDGTPKDLHATVEGITRVKHFGDVAISGRVYDKRIAYKGCSPKQEETIQKAAGVAKYLVDKALYYFDKKSGKALYKVWFDASGRTHKTAVKGVLGDIREQANFPELTYDCVSCRSGTLRAYASTYIFP